MRTASSEEAAGGHRSLTWPNNYGKGIDNVVNAPTTLLSFLERAKARRAADTG